MKKLVIKLIEFYQTHLSEKFFPGCCGFAPTCSHYSKEAINEHGLLTGGILSLKRILRCNPFNKNKGYDPVPKRLDNGKLEKIKVDPIKGMKYKQRNKKENIELNIEEILEIAEKEKNKKGELDEK